MTPYPHQYELANAVGAKLEAYSIAYLAGEERTGKTIAAIIAAGRYTKTILVITKRKAVEGWESTLAKLPHDGHFTVTTFGKAKNQVPHDLVIVDEAHNFVSSYPKPSATWKSIKKLCVNRPIIYCSATPHAQGPQMVYHQLALSSYSPWKEVKNFYAWFKKYGRPYSIQINGVKIAQYDKCHTAEVTACFEHLMITVTRKELGFKQEPEDKLHYITLDDATKHVYNELMDHQLVELKAGTLVCDTTMKLRTSLHMLEGGVAKLKDQYVTLDNCEKLNYIRETFGDHGKLVIMYNYIQEGVKLRYAFSKAVILQATSNAEGVDLSMYDDLVIYSHDFSTAKHTQRRARQANMERVDPIVVHYMLVKGAISSQAYKTVAINKKNFVDSVFTRIKL